MKTNELAQIKSANLGQKSNDDTSTSAPTAEPEPSNGWIHLLLAVMALIGSVMYFDSISPTHKKSSSEDIANSQRYQLEAQMREWDRRMAQQEYARRIGLARSRQIEMQGCYRSGAQDCGDRPY